MLPVQVLELVQLFTALPSVGEKTAQRFALHLATRDPAIARGLGEALLTLAECMTRCSLCNNLAERPVDETPAKCTICLDHRRDRTRLCVVARIQDLMSIERSHAFRGTYFVLGRLLSPLEGIRAEDLPIEALRNRIHHGEVPITEVLLATPPSVDGEATALLLAQELRSADHEVDVTRIASGVPHGGDLEFADPITISRAIAGRRGLE